MTHAELVRLAVRHLYTTRNCSIVISERGGSEMPDAIGWWRNGSVLIECKTSMSDYYAEKRKPHRNGGNLGMGKDRYYLTPKGMLRNVEPPAGWGVLEVRGTRVYRVRESKTRTEWDRDSETRMLLAEAHEWIAAARGADEDMPIRTWEDKFRALRRAAREYRLKDRCPRCGCGLWSDPLDVGDACRHGEGR